MAKIEKVFEAVNQLIMDNPTIQWTIRQMYYRLVSPPYQLFPNTRSSYTYFDKQLVRLRERGKIQDMLFVDTAREIIGGDYGDWDVETYFKTTVDNLTEEATGFSRSYWERQDKKVIVVVEKDALSRLLGNVTRKHRVPLVVGRGYSSRSQIMSVISHMEEDKENVFLYVGDHDPSGLDIERSFRDRLAQEGHSNFSIERIALTYDQAKDLPPNPTKFSDSRAGDYVAEYGKECWEVDAIPPKELVELVLKGILKHTDEKTRRKDIQAEEKGIEILEDMFIEAYEVLIEHFNLEE